MKKRDWKSIIGKCVLISFLAPIAFIIYKIIISPTSNTENIEGLRVKTDYILILSQCVLGVIAFFLPNILSKKMKIVIPTNMYILYVLFLWGAVFLGEVRKFYYKVPHWDTILHTCSGAMLGALGFSFVNILNKHERVHVELSPLFIAIFAFTFAITLGVIWEIYEFAFDGILGLNMQKFALEDGTKLIGRAALVDTMEDLIVDSIGAFIMTAIGFISLKHKKGWIEKILIKTKELKN
ncbi:MAG: hypothetical protein Q4G09_01720 [Clostridia bacterium]|nr:hypothetical protein [Clostridia bacterium]